MEHKRHHYIPQCYLRGFSTNEKSVWVYNKSLSKMYQTSVDKIFYEKNFYAVDMDLVPEDGKDKINVNSIEYEFFAEHIESQYADILNAINKSTNEWKEIPSYLLCGRIPECWVDYLSMQLLIQYIRTPEAREEALELLELSKLHMKALSDSPLCSDEERLYYEKESQRTHGEAIDHFMILFDKERVIDPYCSLLKNKIWSIYYSPEADFFTSDAPIILEREGENKNVNFLELNLPQLHITYPITRHLLVRLWDRESYKVLEPYDRMIRIVDKEFVMAENIRQYVWARKEIVTPNKELDFFEKIRNIRNEEFYCKH